jgi:hypothetical protein
MALCPVLTIARRISTLNCRAHTPDARVPIVLLMKCGTVRLSSVSLLIFRGDYFLEREVGQEEVNDALKEKLHTRRCSMYGRSIR